MAQYMFDLEQQIFLLYFISKYIEIYLIEDFWDSIINMFNHGVYITSISKYRLVNQCTELITSLNLIKFYLQTVDAQHVLFFKRTNNIIISYIDLRLKLVPMGNNSNYQHLFRTTSPVHQVIGIITSILFCKFNQIFELYTIRVHFVLFILSKQYSCNQDRNETRYGII